MFGLFSIFLVFCLYSLLSSMVSFRPKEVGTLMHLIKDFCSFASSKFSQLPMFSKFSNISTFSVGEQKFCCFRIHWQPHLSHVPISLSSLLFCVLLFPVLSAIYLSFSALSFLPYLFLLCVILSVIYLYSLSHPFCHISLLSALSFLPYLSCIRSFLSATSLFPIHFVLSFLPYSFFSLHPSPSFCQIPFSYIIFPSFHSILIFFFDVLYALFSPQMFVFFLSALFTHSWILFCLFLTRRKITVISSLNEIATDHLGNGVGGGGERYSTCPQPFLSRIWTEN